MLEQFIRDCLFGLFGFVIIIWDPYSSVWWLLRVSDSRKGEGRKEKSRKFGEQLKTHKIRALLLNLYGRRYYSEHTTNFELQVSLLKLDRDSILFVKSDITMGRSDRESKVIPKTTGS